MKILGKTINIPFLTEKFKGFFDTGKTIRKKRQTFYAGEYSWRERCKHYDEMCERFGLASQAMFTIAGQLLGRGKDGVFLEPAKNKTTNQPYDRSLEAMHKCEELNDRVGMPIILYELGHSLPKYGSHFWEKTFDPIFDLRVIPYQEGIEPEAMNDVGAIVRWRQRGQFGRVTASWGTEELVEFHWDKTSRSWPYGTSLLAGSETEYESMEQLELSAKDYMEKQAFPYELWQIGDGNYMPTDSDVATIKSKWQNRSVGENMISTYPIDLKQGGTGGAPIRELQGLLDFMKDNVIDRTLVPPISKQYNATQASAKEMMPWALANLIWPIQRMVKWKIENEVYKPYLEDLGFSVKTCPNLLFEPPDIVDVEKGEYLSKGVTAGYLPPKWAAAQAGVPLEEFEEWRKEEEAKEEKMMQNQKNGGEEPNQTEGKSWKVTELNVRRNSESKKEQ